MKPILAALLLTLPLSGVASGQQHSDHATKTATTANVPADGAAMLEKFKALTGEWHAPEGKSVMVNIFRPIAFGTAVLHEEWKDGEQLTATVFYLVDGELHADHFCDFQNQLRFVVHPSSDGASAEFLLRDASNLDTHPRHFHASTWTFRDATHLFQEWQIAEPGKDTRAVRLEFTREKA